MSTYQGVGTYGLVRDGLHLCTRLPVWASSPADASAGGRALKVVLSLIFLSASPAKFIWLPYRCHCCSSACRTQRLTAAVTKPSRLGPGRAPEAGANVPLTPCSLVSFLILPARRWQPLPLLPSALSPYQKQDWAKLSFGSWTGWVLCWGQGAEMRTTVFFFLKVICE